MTNRNHRALTGALALLAAGLLACGTDADATRVDSAHAASADASAGPTGIRLTADQQRRIAILAVQPSSFRPQIEATGTVAFNGDRSTQVLSPVSGPATRIVAQLGAYVSAGAPLAYVSSPDFAEAVASYRKALTAERNARRIATRDSALFANDALARSELEQAQTDAAAAEADVAAAVQNMRALGVEDAQIAAVRAGKAAPIEATIRAPIAGTVVEKLINPGQLLQAGSTPAFTIADLSSMWVMTSVFPSDLRSVAVGQPAQVFTDASPTPIAGRVDYVAALVDPGSKAVTVRVLAPNTGRLLRKDMFVRVAIEAAAPRTGILVPAAAVLRDEQNLPFAFVQAADGTFQRRRVELGARVGDRYEIASGLTPGEKVVGNGALFLQFAESQ